MNGPPQTKRNSWILPAAVVAVAAAVLWHSDPARGGLWPKCPFYVLTGLYCPGCGTSRALHHLLHLHFVTAFRYNPLAILSLFFLAALWRSKSLRTHPRTPAAVLIVVVAYFVLRNVPVKPFVFLAPMGQPPPAFSGRAPRA